MDEFSFHFIYSLFDCNKSQKVENYFNKVKIGFYDLWYKILWIVHHYFPQLGCKNISNAKMRKEISSNFISGLWRISVLYFQTYMLFSNGNRLNVSDTLFNYNHQFGIYLALYSENYKLCQGNRNWVMQHNTRVQLPICN